MKASHDRIPLIPIYFRLPYLDDLYMIIVCINANGAKRDDVYSERLLVPKLVCRLSLTVIPNLSFSNTIKTFFAPTTILFISNVKINTGTIHGLINSHYTPTCRDRELYLIRKSRYDFLFSSTKQLKLWSFPPLFKAKID